MIVQNRILYMASIWQFICPGCPCEGPTVKYKVDNFNCQNHAVGRLPAISILGFILRTFEHDGFGS